jgi:type IV secretion system protein VirD4
LQDARSAPAREVHRDRLIGSKRLDASANIDAIARQIEIRVMPWDAPRRKSGAWLPREPTADSVDGRYRARWRALQGALQGDDRTAGNTITTVQQAMSLFFQDDIRRRCVPSRSRPATDVADLIRRGGTIYLLGREDPYASASPLMTAVAEHVLDTALMLASRSGWGRLCPPMLACLDELPSTAPLPTLRTRMANERALGVSFIYAAQTWRQLAAVFGDQEARALFGLTNVLVMFGGSKDGAFNQEISDLVGQTRVSRTN